MPLTLDPRATALVLVDLQRGTLSMPLAPHGAAQIIDRSVALIRRFKEVGAPVIAIRVAFSADGVDRPLQLVDVPMATPPGGPPPGWSDLDPAIASLQPDVVITKRQWSAFHGTELDLQLRRRGKSAIVVGGITTNFGVESTAREGWQHNYAVVVAEDACTSIDAELHRMSIEKILPRVARVRSTKDVLSAL